MASQSHKIFGLPRSGASLRGPNGRGNRIYGLGGPIIMSEAVRADRWPHRGASQGSEPKAGAVDDLVEILRLLSLIHRASRSCFGSWWAAGAGVLSLPFKEMEPLHPELDVSVDDQKSGQSMIAACTSCRQAKVRLGRLWCPVAAHAAAGGRSVKPGVW